MTALVTGAAGFVGSAVVRQLLERGETVRAFVRPSSDLRNLSDLKIEILRGDLTDRRSIDQAIQGCDSLFHVAADYRLWVPNPAAMFAANVEGTRQMMLAAGEAGVKRIVYTSSVATLGLLPEGAAADEDTLATPADMIGPYKQSKFEAEKVVKQMIAAAGLPAVIVHPSTPIGPRDLKPTPTGKIVVDAASGRMPGFVDTGLNVVHVDDVAIGHLQAFEHGRIGERFILGSENLTLAEILAIVARLCNRRPPSLRIPHDVVMPIAGLAEIWARLTGKEPFATRDGVRLARKKMFFTCDRAIRQLGYQPRPAEAAIADAVQWFAANGYLR
ncbi:MAG TPA: hopanoid-associated sugar epimerase [Dongiaceae bacterium]|nr:hopanoid-associated sugar epimerase [Dongiaceae bacterium]